MKNMKDMKENNRLLEVSREPLFLVAPETDAANLKPSIILADRSYAFIDRDKRYSFEFV